MDKIESGKVTVRFLERSDIVHLNNYFFNSTPEFLSSIGLKPPAPGDAEKFDERMHERLTKAENERALVPIVAVLFNGEVVGYHTSTHHEPGESLIMHAHFFRADRRRLGIGTVSYVKAMDLLFNNFDIKVILFKTPTQNLAPMRIKEKLGMVPVSEETIDWPMLVHPLAAKVFRVTRDQMAGLKVRAGIFDP